MFHSRKSFRPGLIPGHLSLLIKPNQLFRLWLGVTEYLFRKPQLLDEVISTAIEDQSFRRDDLEFTFAARVSTLSLLLA